MAWTVPAGMLSWQEEIKAVSTLPEYQNATAVVYIPGTLGEYNVDTGGYTGGTNPEMIYRGRCRIVGLRSAYGDIQAGNPDSIRPIRIQLAENPARLPDNAKVYFTDGGRNANLGSYVFNVNSDFNSSHVAAYTLELRVSMDAKDADPPQFDEDGDYIGAP